MLPFQRADSYDFGHYPRWNQVVLQLLPAIYNYISHCHSVWQCFCVYIVLHTYICCELTESSCILLCKRNSHECLQEQEEAPWNRKESNVWERGGYLLPFDLLWSELECVLGCRADLQSRGSHRPCYGIFGYLSPRCKSLKTLLNRLRLWACSGNTVGSPCWALFALRVKKINLFLHVYSKHSLYSKFIGT